MRRRLALLFPFIALLTAATAACGSDPAGTTAGAAPTTSPTSGHATSSTHKRAVPTKTVTVTVTRTTTPRPTSTGATTPSTASLSPFVGEWVGHTRDVTVSKSGRLEEHVGDGCCDPIIDLVLQLSNPHRSGGNWVANSRVISATVHDGWKAYGRPAPKPGDRGTVTIGSDHILVESITTNGFCDPDKTAPGTCGA